LSVRFKAVASAILSLISISCAIAIVGPPRPGFPPPLTSVSIADERISPLHSVTTAEFSATPGARPAERTRSRDLWT
jgi:hypothetical protein